MIADPETTKKAIYNIQRKLLEKKRKQLAKEKLEKKEAKAKKLDKKIVLKASKEKLFQKGVKRISIDDRDRFMQTISRIKSRNANLTQKTDVLPACVEAIRLKEKGYMRVDKKPIERSQQLPPHFPHNDITRNHMRTKSNFSNLIPSKFTSKRGSKLRISLQGLMESQDKLRLLTPSPFHYETKNSTLMTDKPQHIVI